MLSEQKQGRIFCSHAVHTAECIVESAVRCLVMELKALVVLCHEVHQLQRMFVHARTGCQLQRQDCGYLKRGWQSCESDQVYLHTQSVAAVAVLIWEGLRFGCHMGFNAKTVVRLFAV